MTTTQYSTAVPLCQFGFSFQVDMEMNTLDPGDVTVLQSALAPVWESHGQCVQSAVLLTLGCIRVRHGGTPQTNTKVELFKLDDTLPPEMFAALCRIGGVRARGMGIHAFAGPVCMLKCIICRSRSQGKKKGKGKGKKK